MGCLPVCCLGDLLTTQPVTAYCVTEYFTKLWTGTDHLERRKEWELDMRFGKWEVMRAQRCGPWIILNWIPKEYNWEASIWLRQ